MLTVKSNGTAQPFKILESPLTSLWGNLRVTHWETQVFLAQKSKVFRKKPLRITMFPLKITLEKPLSRNSRGICPSKFPLSSLWNTYIKGNSKVSQGDIKSFLKGNKRGSRWKQGVSWEEFKGFSQVYQVFFIRGH